MVAATVANEHAARLAQHALELGPVVRHGRGEAQRLGIRGEPALAGDQIEGDGVVRLDQLPV